MSSYATAPFNDTNKLFVLKTLLVELSHARTAHQNTLIVRLLSDCSQVSFGSTSPALSDRREFPLFYRTVAPDSSHNPARIAFIRKYGWDTVTTFSQNEEIYSLAVNELVTELENANISTNLITFAETDFKDQLQLLRVSQTECGSKKSRMS